MTFCASLFRQHNAMHMHTYAAGLFYKSSVITFFGLIGLFTSQVAIANDVQQPELALGSTSSTNIPIFSGDPSTICSNEKFYDTTGTLTSGTKDCGVKILNQNYEINISNCMDNGRENCITTAFYPAVDFTNLIARNIRSSATIAGVTGSMIVAPLPCSDNNMVGCVTTSSYPAADLSNLTSANIKNSVVVAGVTGNYPSAAAPLATKTALPDLAMFGPATPVGTYEFFDSTGAVYNAIVADGGTISPGTINQTKSSAGTMYRAVSIAGDSNLTAANIKSGVTLFGIGGSYAAPTNCAADGAGNCIVDGVSYKAALLSGLANKVLSGQSVAGVAGNVTLPTVANVRVSGGSYGIGGVSSVPTLADCASDGAAGCVAVGPIYAAVFTTGLAPKVIAGNTVAGIAGTAIAAHSNCSADGAIGCLTVAPYKSADMSVAISANIKSGVTIAGVTGSVVPEAHANCLTDGATSCVTSAAYTAAVTTGLADKVLSGQTVAGIAGDITLPAASNVRVTGGSFGLGGTGSVPTLGDCASDGSAGCVAVGPTYAAAFTTGLAGKVLTGNTVAAVAGTAIPAHSNCSSDGATGCLTVAGFVSANTAAITAADLRVSKTIAGIVGSLANCSTDGSTGCVTTASYSAAYMSGIADKILTGQTVAGVSGDVVLPTVNKVLMGTNYGVGGTSMTGTLTLPLASNVIAGSRAYGDPSALMTPAYSISFPPISVRPDAPVITGAIVNYNLETIALTWSNAAFATGYIVLVNVGSPVTFTPTDGSSYSTGTYGSDALIYTGGSTSYTHNTTITANNYYYAIYSYNSSNVYSSVSATSTVLACSGLAGGSWVPVPGNSIYGTGAFCVMKYIAADVSSVPTSQSGATPWNYISQIGARAACTSLGASYHLITNPEWMTIATNAANLGTNWSGSSVGNGTLTTGHSYCTGSDQACAADPNDNNAYTSCDCSTSISTGTFNLRRTQTLSNGSVVWDMTGNVWQWVDFDNVSDKPSPATNNFYEYTNGSLAFTATTPRSFFVPVNSVQSWWNDSWNSTKYVGQIYPGIQGAGGALLRGGNWSQWSYAGLFTAIFNDYDSDSTSPNDGFRCAWHP